MLTHGFARCDRLITDHLSSGSALLEESLLLNDPAVSIDLDRLLFRLSLRVARAPLYGDCISPAALQDHLIPHLRLRQGFYDCTLDVLTPDLTRPIAGLKPHEIRRIFVRVVAIGVAPVIQEFPTIRSRELP